MMLKIPFSFQVIQIIRNFEDDDISELKTLALNDCRCEHASDRYCRNYGRCDMCDNSNFENRKRNSDNYNLTFDEELAQMFEKCPKIMKIVMELNPEVCSSLFRNVIWKCENLTDLQFDNPIEPFIFKEFIDKSSKKLQSLTLAYDDPKLEDILSSIKALPNLEILNIRPSELKMAEDRLAEDFEPNSSVKELTISSEHAHHDLYGTDKLSFKGIVKFIRKWFPNLQKLKIQGCISWGQNLSTIMSQANIKILDISDIKFSTKTWPSIERTFPKLEMLNVTIHEEWKNYEYNFEMTSLEKFEINYDWANDMSIYNNLLHCMPNLKLLNLKVASENWCVCKGGKKLKEKFYQTIPRECDLNFPKKCNFLRCVFSSTKEKQLPEEGIIERSVFKHKYKDFYQDSNKESPYDSDNPATWSDNESFDESSDDNSIFGGIFKDSAEELEEESDSAEDSEGGSEKDQDDSDNSEVVEEQDESENSDGSGDPEDGSENSERSQSSSDEEEIDVEI